MDQIQYVIAMSDVHSLDCHIRIIGWRGDIRLVGWWEPCRHVSALLTVGALRLRLSLKPRVLRSAGRRVAPRRVSCSDFQVLSVSASHHHVPGWNAQRRRFRVRHVPHRNALRQWVSGCQNTANPGSRLNEDDVPETPSCKATRRSESVEKKLRHRMTMLTSPTSVTKYFFRLAQLSPCQSNHCSLNSSGS